MVYNSTRYRQSVAAKTYGEKYARQRLSIKAKYVLQKHDNLVGEMSKKDYVDKSNCVLKKQETIEVHIGDTYCSLLITL